MEPTPVSEYRCELEDGIAAAAAQLDRRNGTPSGTALRGLCWAFWPPSESTPIDVLERLYDDAQTFVAAAAAA